ncbi:MAG: hypothetical protein GWN61_15710, partial [candidate division Zixibacteria bacterium]|nr:hypothetical protein [Phycisphaerae bacterium]NIR65672.1 hypothetical protein [candidate division Zixibacteria bacterium]NIU15471.1 hypothetical protein [candidate division Zixibacteria bacterium]NIV07577.1 hypothetical protein [candidate division Zixibacteria bacterium]NIX01395.1 hypothetical protein [Phycisphaerae bacterium]
MKRFQNIKLIALLALMLLLAGFSGTAMAYTAEYTIDDTGGDCASIG